MALKYFPDHFGALSGLALSHEKLKNLSEAKACIADALRIHPWAANIPTILHTMINKEEEENAKKQIQEEEEKASKDKSADVDVNRLEPVVNPPNAVPHNG